MNSRHYTQRHIINQLNRYLSARKRDLTLKSGYCHGFTLLWLYLMSNGKEAWFYQLVDKIGEITTDEQFKAHEADIELFISHIQWLQYSSLYDFSINQLDLEKLTDIPVETSIACVLDYHQIEKALSLVLEDGRGLCLSGPTHTIGLYQQGNIIHVFDSNFDRLKPKSFTTIKPVVMEIIHSLFGRNYIPDCGLPLEIIAMANKTRHKQTGDAPVRIANFYRQLLETTANVDKPGLDGVTNMHLACESGNVDAVKQLLDRGANPNLHCHEDWLPLHISAVKGYTPIVKLLLAHGAFADAANKSGIKPVDLARMAGHEEVVTLLSSTATTHK